MVVASGHTRFPSDELILQLTDSGGPDHRKELVDLVGNGWEIGPEAMGFDRLLGAVLPVGKRRSSVCDASVDGRAEGAADAGHLAKAPGLGDAFHLVVQKPITGAAPWHAAACNGRVAG